MIKKLPGNVLKDIELRNRARKEAGLEPLVVKIRTCLACGIQFESEGNRTCGCNKPKKYG